jgi:hypothetical protein
MNKNSTNHFFLPAMMICSSLLLVGACGSGGADIASGNTGHGGQVDTEEEVIANFPAGAEVPDNRYVDSYKILIFGNSHVRSHNLPGLLHDLIIAGRPKVKVEQTVAGGGSYLDERLHNKVDLLLLQSNAWTHVILQGQKYSTSGLYSYPIDSSIIWLRAAKAQKATPVLFPEHGQRGNNTEGARVHALHQSIVAAEPGCLAPVGLAWDNMRLHTPPMQLHDADGNHAALAGTFLTALVFYQSITGNNAELLPFLPKITLPEPQQRLLRQIAAATLQQHPACPF